VEGPTYSDINKIDIISNKVKYEYDNCLKAFDIFFKIFHVMRIKYPPQSEHVYEAIEVVIFKSQRKSLKKYIKSLKTIVILVFYFITNNINFIDIGISWTFH